MAADSGSAVPLPAATPGGRLPAARRAAKDRARAYLKLAKLDIVDYYLALPVALSLLAPHYRSALRALPAFAVFLLGEVLVIASAVALDDVTGYRDGSDAANYSSDARRRRLARKPLLTGALPVRAAVRFGMAAAAGGALLWGLAALTAPCHPLWAVAAAGACLITSVQYSWGWKISYRGWQELFLLGFGTGMVLVPYGLATGRITALAGWEAVLFGYGPMLFGLYSNTHDAAGDARVGRRTAAALLTPSGNAAFLTAATAAGAALVAAGPLAAAAPRWLPLALLPAPAAAAAALAVFLRRGDVLRARTLGMRSHRLMAGLLVAANLLVPAIGRHG